MPGIAVVKKTQPRSKANSSLDGVGAEKGDECRNFPDSPPLQSMGHVLKEGEIRSQDVSIREDVHFSEMYFKEEVLAGLHSSGFMKPSPVQLQAIPTGCCGLDLVVQAKSGTGKTLVFTVVALEMVATSAPTCQVLVAAPTREIAVQVAGVLRSVGRHMTALSVQTFIGGMEVERNTSCHIAVGTPGRLHHLLSAGILSAKNIRLLVLDEADQLLESFRNVVLQIVASLPLSKQVICTSATYTPSLEDLAKKMMRSPSHISLGASQLLAVTQYVHKLPYTESSDQAFRAKLLHLKGLLGSAVFNQCLVFTNSVMRCESVYDSLHRDGWPVARLCGGQTQQQRLKALDDLTTHRCRVLVATDLAARGLDSPHVSLVVSLGPPPHPHTYLHRVGRAGRFGSRGVSVVLAGQGDDWLHVQAIATVLDLTLLVLPQPSLARPPDQLQRLPLLTPQQLQQWAAATSHRLTYAAAGGGYDPLEVWKMPAQSGAPQPGVPSEEGGAAEQSCVAASPHTAEQLQTDTSSAAPLLQNGAHQNKCQSRRSEENFSTSCDVTGTTKHVANASHNSTLTSNRNKIEEKEEVRGHAKSQILFNEEAELVELTEVARLEWRELPSSFSFASFRAELADVAAEAADVAATGEEEADIATAAAERAGVAVAGGESTAGRGATAEAGERAARLGVLLNGQHRRNAARVAEMVHAWRGVVVRPNEALTALQRGVTPQQLLAQLQQSGPHPTAPEATPPSRSVPVSKSPSGSQIEGDSFQFHIGVMKNEKRIEKLDKKKEASINMGRPNLGEEVLTAESRLAAGPGEPERSQVSSRGARRKRPGMVGGEERNVQARHSKAQQRCCSSRSTKGHFSPIVLFDRSVCAPRRHEGGSASPAAGDGSSSKNSCASREAATRCERRRRCGCEGCPHAATTRCCTGSSCHVGPGPGRRRPVEAECGWCAREEAMDAELRAHLHCYRKFALMNHYLVVMARTSAAAARSCQRQEACHDSSRRRQEACHDSSRRRQEACHDSSRRRQEACHDSSRRRQEACHDSSRRRQEACHDSSCRQEARHKCEA